MRRTGFWNAVLSVVIIGILIVVAVSFSLSRTWLIGPILLLLGLVPWIPLRLAGRSIQSTGADIIFGAIDTGILTIAALIGAGFAGTLGAIVGGAVGDAITDALAGLFEGGMAATLRKHGIEEARTPLSSSMGKMSGCLLGAGCTLIIAWSFLGLPM